MAPPFTAIEAPSVVGPDPIHDALRAERYLIAGIQCAAPVDIGPRAPAVSAAFQLISLQIVFGVGTGRPGNRDAFAAIDCGRDGDFCGHTGGGIVDNGYLIAGPVTGVKALAVIGPDPVHDALCAERYRIAGTQGTAPVNVGPCTAAVGAAF